MKIALIGNQNCGKTTLFNDLTGSNQHVGNFPGVTVSGKFGVIKKNNKNIKEDITLVDLPGIYSLSPYSNEEIVTRDFIINEKPDVILNILDATNIERNLYLTLQLCELNVPVIGALNMMDEVTKSGNSIDILKLEQMMGIPLVGISAASGEGVDELIDRTIKIAKEKTLPNVIDFCKDPSPVHRAIHAMMELISDHALNANLPLRYAATHLIEGDSLLESSLDLTENEHDIVLHIVTEMETDSKLDREECLATMRYQYIDSISYVCVNRINPLTKEQIRTNKIDKFLTNKYTAFPFFILIMGLIFYLTFGLIGKYLSDWLQMFIDFLIRKTDHGLTSYGLNPVVKSLLVDGIFTGVGSVISFLPTIVVLFLFLSILEDSGYMARIAFIMDKPLRKLGLSGRSFVPMLIGFGCSVPAVMSTRTLTSDRDKKITLLLIPFMPCSAKLPIFTVIGAAFFGVTSPLIIILVYLISILIGLIIALILKIFISGKPTPFMMELPSYRMPSFKNTCELLWEKAKDFLKKAFTIIFVATIVIWCLQSFNTRIIFVDNNSKSMLASIGRIITPIFKPIGVEKWEISASIISGLSAKEAVVSTMSVLLGSISLENAMGAFQAFTLLLFVVLYMPCIATFSVLRKELNSTKMAVLYMASQTVIAYVITMIVYQIGSHI